MEGYKMDLIPIRDNDLFHSQPELEGMVNNIESNLPEIRRATKNFGKTQSQYMDNMLTISHPTPIRNLRQILAEVEKTYTALQQSFYKHKKDEIKAKMKLRDIEKTDDELDKDLLGVEYSEIKASIEASEKYISGAIRKISNYLDQYNRISEKLIEDKGVDKFTELDFEEEEERYHIMTAFAQALTAARARGGIIDEGNHIYFYQIGINGSSAQMEVRKFLESEGKQINEGRGYPQHDQVLDFLNRMAETYKNCSTIYAGHKGVELMSKPSLIEG